MVGADLIGSACTYNTTYVQKENWGTSTVTLSSSWTKSHINLATVNTTNCDPSNYVFGYFGYDSSGNSLFPAGAHLDYSATGYGTNHYGVHIRAALLFIDNWTDDISIIFR
jgi:hypothetical protein